MNEDSVTLIAGAADRAASLVYAILAGSLWLSLAGPVQAGSPVDAHAPPPRRLSDTGLFQPASTRIAPQNLAFSPQYPLWSDGAVKRRWLYLPPGTAIDASNPDAWNFPPGTRVWKEFRYVKPVETRFIERLPDGCWQFATYIWNAEGDDALLAPAEGVAKVAAPGAPDGWHAIPSRDDCLACHEGTAVPVLGASALQLSPDRDPHAPHAEATRAGHLDLRALVERGMLQQLPQALIDVPPRIPGSPITRAALGYLHGNCGHCHNDDGPLAALDFSLQQAAVRSSQHMTRTLETTVGRTSDFRIPGLERRVVAGEHEASLLLARMRSRDALMQMPPLGTHVTDADASALITYWIEHDLQAVEETQQ